MLRRFIFLFFSLLFLFFPQKAEAAVPNQKFSISYDVRYQVHENGMTTVTQIAHLKNLTSDYYPSQYKSKITNGKIQNLRGFDRLGALKINITKSDEGQDIQVIFNDKNVGIGNIYTWTLVFESPEIARQTGRIWEIVLPKPSDLENIETYNIILTVPPSFGKAAYLKPQPQKNYIWSKDQVASSGIFAAFGDYQLYNFRLTYHLKNSGAFGNSQQIALPPTTSYQEIYLENIDPKPKNVTVDGDGNWMASYDLEPRKSTDVIVSGTAQVFFQPRYKNPPPNLSTYLRPQAYWETTDPKIASLAAGLSTPQNIYKYVVSNLSYDAGRVDQELIRFGAKSILENPASALCMEFTDLFVALARSAKIPAREVEGYAQTNNEKRQPVSLRKDILHAWPEFYDTVSSTWRMVDPTWENTTGGINYFDEFDFNHIVFAIHGMDSYSPQPAGGYKTEIDTKDVLVNFEKDLPAFSQNLLVTSNITPKLISGFTHNFQVTLENRGTKAINISSFDITSNNATMNVKMDNNSLIPPYGTKVVPFSLLYPDLFGSQSSIITVDVNGNKTYFETGFVPAYQKLEFIVPAISGVIFTGAGLLWFTTKKSRHLSLF